MRSAFATFGCSHNSCAGELPRSASSHFIYICICLYMCIRHLYTSVLPLITTTRKIGSPEGQASPRWVCICLYICIFFFHLYFVLFVGQGRLADQTGRAGPRWVWAAGLRRRWLKQGLLTDESTRQPATYSLRCISNCISCTPFISL